MRVEKKGRKTGKEGERIRPTNKKEELITSIQTQTLSKGKDKRDRKDGVEVGENRAERQLRKSHFFSTKIICQ